jgi:hypothetical protein
MGFFLPRLRGPSFRRILFVCFKELDPEGDGKISPHFFFPAFRNALRPYGITVEDCSDEQLAAQLDRYRGQPIILVYREVHAATNSAFALKVASAEAKARGHTLQVLHGLSLGLLIANKKATHRAMQEAGVPVPKLIEQRRASVRVFSNDNCSSGADACLVDAGCDLNQDRYNTEYIDTTHLYEGRHYHVALRAMCVGRSCTSIYISARPIEDGSPSVHDSNTPHDAGLLNDLHRRIVVPRKARIDEICRAIGARLGPAFYSHDLLPSNSTQDIYVCETGFKFNQQPIGFSSIFPFTFGAPGRSRLAPSADDIPAAIERSAHALVSALAAH